MAFGAIDCPTRDVASLQMGLSALDAKLANAKKQRDTILIAIRKASAAVDAGDQRARFAQAGLNKEADSVGRLEGQVSEARKRVEMAEVQAATVAAKRASVDAAAVAGDRLFEVETPDGRKVRHRYTSSGALQKMLQPGYRVVAEVFGAGIDGREGLVEPIGQSTMKTLLAAHGDELLAFLAERGIIGSAAIRS
jgi:hypothetical protein